MREARARFAELLDDAEHGNITLITRHGHAAAAIVPVALLGRLEAPGGGPLVQEAGHALEAAVTSLRSALRALDTLAGQASAAAAPGARRAVGWVPAGGVTDPAQGSPLGRPEASW